MRTDENEPIYQWSKDESPWSEKVPNESGAYWLRMTEYKGAICYEEYLVYACVITRTAKVLVSLAQDFQLSLDNIKGEWAKAEPPK